MDSLKLAETLEYAIEHDLPTFVWGKPGIGKTQIVRQVAAKLGRKCLSLTLATMESVDLRGLPMHAPKGVEWARPDFLVRLDELGDGAVLFVDEANANAQSVQVPLMQLVLERHIGPHALPDGTRIVMAGNRMSDKAAAQRMNTALADRLFHVDFEASLKPWLKWASSAGVHPAVLAFLMLRGEGNVNRPGLFDPEQTPLADQRSRPGPRAWTDAARAVDAPDSVRFGLIAGRVGEAAAAEFEGFLKVFRSLPPIPQIIAKPDTATVPDEPSLQYAVSVALGHAANPANLAAVSQYMGRVGREFQIVTMTDAVRRKPELAETPAYIRWAAANADVAI